MMKSFNATDAKNRFGDLLDASTKEPVLVTKNGSSVAYMVPAEQFDEFVQSRPILAVRKAIAESDPKVIELLTGFSLGNIPKRSAMRQLGISWYEDLLEALGYAGLSLPVVGEEQRKKMVSAFVDAVHD